METATARCRCGYELRDEWDRCPSCHRRLRSRRRPEPAPVPIRSGPDAAEAWARHRDRPEATVEPQPLPAGGLAGYRDAAPAAGRLGIALRLLRLAFVALAVLEGARLALALAARDAVAQADLRAADAWAMLASGADLAAVVVAAGAGLSVALAVLWIATAVPNLAALDLRLRVRRPVRVVAGTAATGAAAVLASRALWADGGFGPERAGAAVGLVVGIAGAVVAHELRQAAAAVTVREATEAGYRARVLLAASRSR